MDKKTKLPNSIKLYLSRKLKKVPSLNLNSPINPSRLRSACKYPKTPSFVKRDPNTNHNTINHATTLSDIDRFLSEKFHSLYINNNNSSSMKQHERMHADFSGNLASTSSMASSLTNDENGEREAGSGVVTFSMDPYKDFKSSMKRMVEAHHADSSQPLDWDFLEELLLCYLELNDKSMHKHVLRAFTDITAGFLQTRVSVMSRRTVPVQANMRRQKGVEREEISDSPGQQFQGDFPEDCIAEQIN